MVKWSDHAKADLRHIHDFIAEDSKHYAKMVTQAIVDKTLRLSGLPKIGKMVPEIRDENIRELHEYSYRIKALVLVIDSFVRKSQVHKVMRKAAK